MKVRAVVEAVRVSAFDSRLKGRGVVLIWDIAWPSGHNGEDLGSKSHIAKSMKLR